MYQSSFGRLVVAPDGCFGLLLSEMTSGDDHQVEVFLSDGLIATYPYEQLKPSPLGPSFPPNGAPANFIEVVRAYKLYEELVSLVGQAATASVGIEVLRKKSAAGKLEPQRLQEAEHRVTEMHERLRFLLASMFTPAGLLKLASVASSAAGSEISNKVNVAEVSADGKSETITPAPNWNKGEVKSGPSGVTGSTQQVPSAKQLLGMNLNPSVVGYWAVVHGLSTSDLLQDPAWSNQFNSWDDEQNDAYEEARKEAAEELRSEALEEAMGKLHDSLREALS